MTDTFHYQDVYKTINIPKTERRLAQKAKNIFDVATGAGAWDPNIYEHLSRVTDGESASQAFWDFEDDDNHAYDRLALTIMRRGLTIALEHRDFTNKPSGYRQTMLISQGVSKVYTTDLLRNGVQDLGSTSEESLLQFKSHFYETVADLGLYSQIKRLQMNQNESSSAILANVA